MNRRRIAAGLALTAILFFLTAQACGPEFFPDTFVRQLRPDNPQDFAAGKLGILLPTFPRTDLIVAYRYLNGGTLDAHEQKAYEPYTPVSESTVEGSESPQSETTPQAASPLQSWTALRSQYGKAASNVEPNGVLSHTDNGYTYTTEYTNCNDSAFHTAVLTLQSRAKTWGAQNPDLENWIQGQDTVFANCHRAAALPLPAPAASTPLLHQDRAYQSAAALFYQGKYTEARAAFEAIAAHSDSPWQGIAPYLAARCLIRQAFLPGTTEGDTGFGKIDPIPMQQAESILESQLKQPHPGIRQEAIEAMLDLIRIRLKPASQVNVLAKHLAGDTHDPRYAQHLTDLSWYLDSKLDHAIREDTDLDTQVSPEDRPLAFTKAWNKAAAIRAYAPLADWLITYQSAAPEAREHAFSQWRNHPGPIWLIAALAKALGHEPSTPALLQAAASLKPTDPAWTTAQYHRIRLLLATGKIDEARKLLEESMPRIQASHSDSTLNAYTGLRMHAALDLNELLAFAPRLILERTSESRFALDECLEVMKDPKRVYDCREDKSPNQFSDDAAGFFNTAAPLSVLVEAAQSSHLPEPLRRSLTLMAWTRSILLTDETSAQKLFPFLPARLKQQAAPGTGFPALTAVARNAGLRPFLDPGIQRMASYDFVQSYRDNWWCEGARGNVYQRSIPTQPLHAASVSFLNDGQRAQAAREAASLSQLPDAKVVLGTRILEYTQSHPDDLGAPESLYLILRMIRYGCNVSTYPETPESKAKDDQIARLRKDAARLLRQRYAASPWTKKAAPFAG